MKRELVQKALGTNRRPKPSIEKHGFGSIAGGWAQAFLDRTQHTVRVMRRVREAWLRLCNRVGSLDWQSMIFKSFNAKQQVFSVSSSESAGTSTAIGPSEF